jgi:isopenicillin-N epimerase
MPLDFPEDPGDFARHWTLDPTVHFLNHGSFGACPRPVLELQQELRARLEREPVLFLHRELEPLLDEVNAALGALLGADPEDFAFVPNATSGVNTVLRSLRLAPGDEILLTDHAYNSCRNAVATVCERAGARLVTARVPFPIDGPEAIVDAIVEHVTPRTKLLLIDHITSPTAMVQPLAQIVREMTARGVDVLVDGAHAPGQIPLDLRSLGAAYYTGNCHKWLCAPKGSAFLWVRRDRQEGILPLSVSHGVNSPRTDRSRFRLNFDWVGTVDPTPWLCVPAAIRFLERLLPGGLPTLQERNHRMVCAGRRLLCEKLSVAPPAPESMLGSLAAVPLPADPSVKREPPLYLHPLQTKLFDERRIELPVVIWPDASHFLLRISAQAYNTRRDYEALAAAL